MSVPVTFTDSETESQFQLNGAIQGKRGAYFNRLGNCSKALRDDLDLVDSVGQPLGVQFALTIRSECLAILIALAEEVNRGSSRPIPRDQRPSNATPQWCFGQVWEEPTGVRQ